MQTKPKKPEYPERDELVIGTVKSVFPYGAFIKLEEYPGKEGMIHVSEISHKWVKNIKDHVKEGERIVVKVLRIDLERGHIDLSLKSVKAIQKKQKIEGQQQESRGIKLVELAGERLKDKGKIEEVCKKLEEHFDSVYTALESVVIENEKALKEVGLDAKWADELTKIAQEHIKKPSVSIKATIEINSTASDGIEVIKNALSDAINASKQKEVELEITYQGTPKYRISIIAPDYKKAEKSLELFSNELEAKIKSKGEFEVKRD
ncbi:MAG: translation initiation factor IF-2 subunit alpha [archaeon]